MVEHRQGLIPGFTARYGIFRLVHFELFAEIRDAIAREKEIKGWRPEKKIWLIEHHNPTWEDLAELLPSEHNNQEQILTSVRQKRTTRLLFLLCGRVTLLCTLGSGDLLEDCVYTPRDLPLRVLLLEFGHIGDVADVVAFAGFLHVAPLQFAPRQGLDARHGF